MLGDVATDLGTRGSLLLFACANPAVRAAFERGGLLDAVNAQPTSTQPPAANGNGYAEPDRAPGSNQLSYGFGGCGGHLSMHLPSGKGVHVGPDFFLGADGSIDSPQIRELQRQAARCEAAADAAAEIPPV